MFNHISGHCGPAKLTKLTITWGGVGEVVQLLSSLLPFGQRASKREEWIMNVKEKMGNVLHKPSTHLS